MNLLVFLNFWIIISISSAFDEEVNQNSVEKWECKRDLMECNLTEILSIPEKEILGKDPPNEAYVFIQVRNREPSEQLKHGCGGFLVTKSVIVTAAHCFYDQSGNFISNPDNYKIVIGSKSDISLPVDIRVSQILKHPDYNPQTRENDIGVIRIDFLEMEPKSRNDSFYFDGKQFQDGFQLTRLEREISPNTVCNSYIWKELPEKDISTYYLTPIKVKVISKNRCEKLLKNNRIFFQPYHICTKSLDGNTYLYNDATPLICNNTFSGMLSFKEFPADFDNPTVYTDIAKFYNFVESSSVSSSVTLMKISVILFWEFIVFMLYN